MLEQCFVAAIVRLHKVQPVVVFVGGLFQSHNLLFLRCLAIEQIEKAVIPAHLLIVFAIGNGCERVSDEIGGECLDPWVYHQVDVLGYMPERRILKIECVELVRAILG